MNDNETIDEATKMAMWHECIKLLRGRYGKYSELTKEERALHKKLKNYQRMKANGIKANERWIASNSSLVEMAMVKPRSIYTLGHIGGFHWTRVEKYGEDLVSIINSHLDSAGSDPQS
jgi:ribonuclease D